MSDPAGIDTVLRVLERSKSTSAQAVLMHALNVDDADIRDRAARSLMHSSSAIAKTEVIRHVDRLSPGVVQELFENGAAVRFPLRQCIEHGDQETSLKALETIEAAGLFDEIPLLLRALNVASGSHVERVEQVLLALVDRIYHNLVAGQESARAVCDQLLLEFSSHIGDFEKQRRPRTVIESLLILADPNHGVARQLTRESSQACQAIAWEVLLESRHPGVVQFLVDSLGQKYVHPRILEIFGLRDDIEFQLGVIARFPKSLTLNQERNFCQLGTLPWLRPCPELWRRLPPEWHANVVRLFEALTYLREHQVAFYETVFTGAAIPARELAARHRDLIPNERFERIVLGALESDDEQEQAWAVSGLMATNLPDRYRLLVNRLDSPAEVVQERARAALGRFDVYSAINYCEYARPEIGPKLAELFLKINPHGLLDLKRELANPVRSRRLKAAKAVAFMRLQQDVADALIELLHDTDSIVRRTVVEILADVPTAKVVSAISLLVDDSSPRVREAVQAALDNIECLKITASETLSPQELTSAAAGEVLEQTDPTAASSPTELEP